MDFSERTIDDSYEKIQPVALYFGLFPRLQWKMIPFRASDGNPRIQELILWMRNF